MSEPLADSFADYLTRARDGDEAALLELVHHYEPEIRIVLRVILGPALRQFLDATDVVQSVHCDLLQGLRQRRFDFSTPDDLLRFMRVLVRRKVARKWRHLKKQAFDGPTHPGLQLEDILAGLMAREPNPDDAAQQRDAVAHLLEQLEDGERRILELRLSGYEPCEIAAALRTEPNYVRVRLHRLRVRLQGQGIAADRV